MDEVCSIAKDYDLRIVEDTAQSFGTKYDKKYLGTIGDVGCFSFFPTKTLGAYGDGGAIATDDEEIAKRAKMLKNHGASKKYFNEIVGYNSRLDSIQASFLKLKLEKIDKYINLRQKAGEIYNQLLRNNENVKIVGNQDSSFNYYSIILNRGSRDNLQEYLTNEGIATAIYYPKTLPSLPAHNLKDSFPVSEYLANNILSLPIFPQYWNLNKYMLLKKIDNFFNQDE